MAWRVAAQHLYREDAGETTLSVKGDLINGNFARLAFPTVATCTLGANWAAYNSADWHALDIIRFGDECLLRVAITPSAGATTSIGSIDSSNLFPRKRLRQPAVRKTSGGSVLLGYIDIATNGALISSTIADTDQYFMATVSWARITGRDRFAIGSGAPDVHYPG